jgi:phosphate transport system substrate-binding protein
MKTKIILKIFLLFLGFFITVLSCGKSKYPITVAGSTAFQPFAEKLADMYMQANPDINITVQGGGSAVGIQSALSGAAQIGMADLVELPPEAKALTATVVARDGIAIVVNIKNSVNNLTLLQIQGIYNGKIKNWKEVGGNDHSITIISREAGSGTRSSFESIVKNISLTKDAIIQDSNGTVRETVINDVNAIGYLSHGLINEKIKPLSVNGIASTTEEIIKGNYILVRPIFLLTKDAPKEKIKDFIDYILSSNGQEILKANGLIPAK